jgi:hypothetical protein
VCIGFSFIFAKQKERVMAEFQGKIMVGVGELIATVDNKSYHITKDHAAYDKLFEAYKSGDADTFVELSNVQQSMERYTGASTNPFSDEGLVMDGEKIYYNGVELNNAVVETIRAMMYNDMDFQPMLKFLERAIKSNSKRVIDELFKFLQVCRLTITEDGCFLAYKSVREDYMDKYSGTYTNVVGTENRMQKFQVDDNCNVGCSYGFHVGSLPYAGPGGYYNASGDKVLICKVAPEDVVSVPLDCSCQKLRTCAYTVVGEFQGELKSTVYSGKVGDSYAAPPDPKRQLFYLDPEDMRVDGVYRALYESAYNGETKWRHFVVLDTFEDHVVAELMDPEEDCGYVRRFNFDSFDIIHEWDGKTVEDDDEEDEDEEDDYDEA